MKYGFIGCGNMGGAIARALSKATKSVEVCDRSGKAALLAEELGISYGQKEHMAQSCDRLFLAVKPHMLGDVISPLRSILKERKPLLISMAAGVEIGQIEALVGEKLPVIRIMPNTPTGVGKGIVAYCCNEAVEEAVLKDWLEDMRFCGLLECVEERLMDAVSALSGSGPAFVYMMLEAMADGAVSCGLPREKALSMAAMTLGGSAELYLQTRQHPGALKDAVCSPGGSTIVGVQSLERHGFRGAVMECIINTFNKNKQLGK